MPLSISGPSRLAAAVVAAVHSWRWLPQCPAWAQTSDVTCIGGHWSCRLLSWRGLLSERRRRARFLLQRQRHGGPRKCQGSRARIDIVVKDPLQGGVGVGRG